MAARGRPPLPDARSQGVFVRFSDTEWGALQQALRTEHPGPAPRPTLPQWIRDLVVAHAGAVLRVEVTQARLGPVRGGAPDWKRWRLAQAVRRARPHRRKVRR
jgi:hypothetical protein